jgi:hypothetical protein
MTREDTMEGKSYAEPRNGGYWGGTRVPLGSLVYAFRGHTAENLAQSFRALTLEQVYGALEYYLANREVIDACLQKQEADFTRLTHDLS